VYVPAAAAAAAAVLPNTAWMPFLASQDIKTAAGKRAEVRLLLFSTQLAAGTGAIAGAAEHSGAEQHCGGRLQGALPVWEAA